MDVNYKGTFSYRTRNIGKKLREARERDRIVNRHYLGKGWHLLRIWEHDIKSDFPATVSKITDFIETAKLHAAEK